MLGKGQLYVDFNLSLILCKLFDYKTLVFNKNHQDM